MAPFGRRATLKLVKSWAAALNALIETLKNLGPTRLAAMAVVAAGTLAFFIFLTSRLSSPDMSLLYADLSSQDSAQIIARLEQLNQSYRLSNDGTQIFVPTDKVGSIRFAMAEEGLPSGGSMGYEIFDRSEGLGTTNFVQNINHLRALEGELARTIRSINQVRSARVHLVLPRRELFSRDRQDPSASIVLTMRGGRRLERDQVQAIQNLVASAVPGLEPSMVSIVDNKGTLLARGVPEGSLEGAASTAEEMRIRYETRMARTIEDLLERTVGPGNVRAEVSAEMDFDRITENAEIYDPDGQVVRSTQTVEESSAAEDSEGRPPVTVGNNLPDAGLPADDAGATNKSNSARVEETVNYEISRTVKNRVREAGLVRKLSVAVLVNGVVSTTADGETTYQPRSEAELEQIAALVSSAAGIDEARGDSLEVANLRFAQLDETLGSDGETGLFGLGTVELARIAEVLVLGVVGVLILLLIVRPVITRLLDGTIGGGAPAPGQITDRLSGQAALTGPEAAALPPGGAAAAALGGAGQGLAQLAAGGEDGEGESMIDMVKVEGRVRMSSIKKIGEIVEKHPEECVAIVRSWLHTEH